jgi:hypothetical protein
MEKTFYLDKAIAEVDLAEVVGPGEVTVEGRGVELREDEHFVDAAVDAVAHRHVDQAVRPSKGHLKPTTTTSQQPVLLQCTHSPCNNLSREAYSRLCTSLGERVETRSGATPKDDGQHCPGIHARILLHVHLKPKFHRHQNSLLSSKQLLIALR